MARQLKLNESFANNEVFGTKSRIRLLPSVYSRAGGDFVKMIQDPAYVRAIFVFNDDEDRYGTGVPGKGNACVRGHPRAFGIPTGRAFPTNQGYSRLTEQSKTKIDIALAAVKDVLATGNYDTVVYSADASGNLGTGYFVVGQDVKSYIVDSLKNLADP